MESYALNYLSDNDVMLFNKIRVLIDKFDDIDLGKDESGEKIILSCHIMARALARIFSLDYADGYFQPNYEHSWLVTPRGNIIDIYPINALGGPLLYVNGGARGFFIIKKGRLSS